MRFPRHLLLLSACFAAPALAQSSDKPLGDILDAIEEPAAPAPVPAPRPVPPPPPPADGIEPADLPASIIPAPDARRPGSPFGTPTAGTPPTADDLVAEEATEDQIAAVDEEAVAAVIEPEADVLFSAEARLAAEAEARETARLAEADRRMAERAAATARAQEQRMIAHQEEVAAAEAAAAQAAADYQAALDANRAEAARQRAAWEARVIACQAGDKTQCAQPGE